jgi:hypothetical protein
VLLLPGQTSEAPSGNPQLFLGPDLLEWVLLALGGALFVGNVLALLRPPPSARDAEGRVERPPVARSLVMALIGLVSAVWALASLVGS